MSVIGICINKIIKIRDGFGEHFVIKYFLLAFRRLKLVNVKVG